MFHPNHGGEMSEHLGELEQLILLSLLRLQDEAYGVSVHEDLTSRTGRSMTLATVYTTLSRLEQKGYVTAAMGEPTPERGGRRKKYFVMSADGQRALQQSLDAIRAMAQGLEPRALRF